jgi:coronin-2
MEVVDCSSGLLIPYYDSDTKIVYVAGKGDGNIRYYEITDTDPYLHYLSEYKSSAPQRGLGFMPKRGLDVTKNEIFRFYKLHATGGICEPISMIVPRKSEVFQEDIYPDALSGIPSLSCDEWLMGENRDPILISMKDGAVPFMPKIITYKQLGYSELGNNFSRSYANNHLHLSKPMNSSSSSSLAFNGGKNIKNSITNNNNNNNGEKKSHQSNNHSNGNNGNNQTDNIMGSSSSSQLNNSNNDLNNFRNGNIDHSSSNAKFVQSSRSAFSNYFSF